MKYADSHEWIHIEGNRAKVGISDYAQKELGEIVFVELPKVGMDVKQGEEACVLESTKAAADVYSPMSGKITRVNERLFQATHYVNQSAESEGWLFEIEISEPAESEALMSREDYLAQL